MPQDAFTLRTLSKELNGLLAGGKINRIVQPENERVEFSVYTGKNTEKLILDVKPSSPRIGISKEERSVPLTAPNFCMLLRKHLLGATVENISLIGYDRVVKIRCTSGGEFTAGEEKTLFVELMGRYSNIILTEGGKVLGGNRGINFFDNGVRPLIVGRAYVFPPVSGKKPPNDESLKEYFNSYCGDNLAKFITAGVQGVAESTAEEIAYRYFLYRKEYDGDSFYGFLKDFLYADVKNPCVSEKDGKVKDVFVFPYQSEKNVEYKFFKELYFAEDYYFINKEKEKDFTDKINRLSSCVASFLKKTDKKISLLSAREKDALNAEEYKVKGELILSNVYLLKRGDKTLKTVNYYDNSEIEISLDENLTPAENAEKYYKKYGKAKRAMQNLIPQKEMLISERDYLLSVKDEIGLAESVADAETIRTELINGGYIKERCKSGKKKPVTEKRTFVIDGFIVKVGRNNVENDEITLSAKKTDLWLHAKDFHSSHVIIETGGKEPLASTVIKAAQICAYYSKARNGGNTEIVYARKKDVKKPKGAKAGFFVYDNYASVVVKPEKHDELLKND